MLDVSRTDTGLKISSEHGSVCLSSDGDKIFAHDLEGDGRDSATVFELWTELQAIAKKLGYKELYAHINADEERLYNVYTKRGGMTPVSIILKKDL